VSLARAVRVVGSLTLLSRVAGLVRDVVTARLFGDTAVGSAFAAAFAVPNTFRRLFGEGALAAAFVPEYARLAATDARAASRLASLTVAALVVVTGTLTLAGEVGLWLALPADPGARRLSMVLVMVALPFMPLICVAATLAGVLQTHGRFGPPAAQPMVLNACVLAAAAIATGAAGLGVRATAVALCAAVVLSGIIQVAWSLWALRRHVRWTASLGGVGASGRRVASRWAPAVLGMGTLQVSTLIDVLLAMWPLWVGATMLGFAYPMDEQSNAVLFYAQRLYQFPLGVFGVAVATAAFPTLSRLAGDGARFASALADALAMSVAIALPAGVGLALVAPDLVALLLAGWGSFSDDGAGRARAALVAYSAAIWAYSANQVLARAYYARGDTRTPALVAVGVLALNLALNLTLLWWLREAGLAWATAIAAGAQTLALGLLLGRRHGVTLWRALAARCWRVLPCTACMAAAVAGVLETMPTPQGWGQAMGRLAAGVGAGALVYGAAAWALGYREVGRLLGGAAGKDDADGR